MGEGFDAYRKWLGIPPKDQPPNHYRLLGVVVFEADADVIEAAANRHVAFIETYLDSERRSSAKALIKEIEAARLCLLDRRRRAEYDAKLKRTLAEKREQEEAEAATEEWSAPPPPASRPPAPPPEARPPAAPPPPAPTAQAPPVVEPVVAAPTPIAPPAVENNGAGLPVVQAETPRIAAAGRTLNAPAEADSGGTMWIVAGLVTLALVSGGVTLAILKSQDSAPAAASAAPTRQVRGGQPIHAQNANASQPALPIRLQPVLGKEQFPEGFLVDNRDTLFPTGWRTLSGDVSHPYIGEDFYVSPPRGKRDVQIVFGVPTDFKPGDYRVRISYVPGQDRTTKAPVEVTFGDGKKKRFTIDQRKAPSAEGPFYELDGVFHFENRLDNGVTISNADVTDGVVSADAVQFIPASKEESKAAVGAKSSRGKNRNKHKKRK